MYIKKAMILAAGFGMRARPLTLVRPKPLFPVMNRPLISYTIDRLRRANVTDVVVNTHHLAEKVESFLDGVDNGMSIRTIREEDEILGTGGGVKNAEKLIGDEPFLLLNSDIMTECDLLSAVEAHYRARPAATLVMHDYPEFNQAAVDMEGRILGFRGRTVGPEKRYRTLAFTGIHVISPEVFRFIPQGPGDIISVYQDMIERGCAIRAHVAENAAWWDAGSLERYLGLHEDLFEKQDGERVIRGRDVQLSSGAQVKGWAVFGEGAIVGPGAVIEKSVIWPGAEIGEGVRVINSVIADDVHLNRNTENEAVVGGP